MPTSTNCSGNPSANGVMDADPRESLQSTTMSLSVLAFSINTWHITCLFVCLIHEELPPFLAAKSLTIRSDSSRVVNLVMPVCLVFHNRRTEAFYGVRYDDARLSLCL